MLLVDLLILEQLLLPLLTVELRSDYIAGYMLTASIKHPPFESVQVFMRFGQPFLHQ
jgi:hypothetical protein